MKTTENSLIVFTVKLVASSKERREQNKRHLIALFSDNKL